MSTPEQKLTNLLDAGLHPREIEEKWRSMFDVLPWEYENVLKRAGSLYDERTRNVGKERKSTANYRDAFLAGKAKRH